MTSRFRAAVYARFSSDLQRDRSIEDQVALCRDYAARNGYGVVAVFEDRAVTGASIQLRPGIQTMLAAARAGDFDYVIAESLSRLARDQEDSPAIRKRLDFAGVKIVTPSDGVVSPLMHGLRTIIDSQFLVDLKGAIRRGMRGVIRDGRFAGGLAYGYEPVPGKPGELRIVSSEAEIVQRIFAEYIAGDSPRAIAERFNSEGVKAPRGSYWRASTINGHTQRKTGILQNELYCGRLIWNRAYRVRDPDSARMIWRYNSESEWQRGQAPHLRIITDAVFEEAQHRRAKRSKTCGRAAAPPKRILSGLLRCGCCGAGMSKKDTDHGRPRIICTRMREARTCSNRRPYYLDEIERIVIGGLREELGTREAVAYFVQCYNEERQRSMAAGSDCRGGLEAEIASLDRQIDRGVAAIIQGRITEAEAAAHLPPLRRRRAAAAAELAALEMPPAVIKLRPAAVENYLRDLERLDELINADLAAGEAGPARLIRQMIETVTIMPSERGTAPGIVVRGELSQPLGVAAPSIYRADFAGGNGGAG